MKKVALIGTHGVRKTTYCHSLTHYLKTEGIEVGFLEETARKSPFPINEGTTENSQRWILHNQILEELGYEIENPQVLIGDRASIDNYAYFVEAFGRREALDNLVKEHVKTYDTLIMIPISPGMKIREDGVRSTDKKFQERIDLRIKELLEEFEVPFIKFRGIKETGEYILNRLR